MRLKLNALPDGFGFIYGDITLDDGTHYRVNIMPAAPHWQGDIKLEDEYGPHATD